MRLKVDTKVGRNLFDVFGVSLSQSVCVCGFVECGKGCSA